jgi:hypothetical protein
VEIVAILSGFCARKEKFAPFTGLRQENVPQHGANQAPERAAVSVV